LRRVGAELPVNMNPLTQERRMCATTIRRLFDDSVTEPQKGRIAFAAAQHDRMSNLLATAKTAICSGDAGHFLSHPSLPLPPTVNPAAGLAKQLAVAHLLAKLTMPVAPRKFRRLSHCAPRGKFRCP